jgi:hypothetical protein
LGRNRRCTDCIHCDLADTTSNPDVHTSQSLSQSSRWCKCQQLKEVGLRDGRRCGGKSTWDERPFEEIVFGFFVRRRLRAKGSRDRLRALTRERSRRSEHVDVARLAGSRSQTSPLDRSMMTNMTTARHQEVIITLRLGRRGRENKRMTNWRRMTAVQGRCFIVLRRGGIYSLEEIKFALEGRGSGARGAGEFNCDVVETVIDTISIAFDALTSWALAVSSLLSLKAVVGWSS